MSLQRFANINNLLIPATEQYGTEYSNAFLNAVPNRIEYSIQDPSDMLSGVSLEMHLLASNNNGDVIDSAYDIQSAVETAIYGNDLSINLNQAFGLFGRSTGTSGFILNVHQNKISNYNLNGLIINEVSPDRTEVSVRINPNLDSETIAALINDIKSFYLNGGSDTQKKLNPLVNVSLTFNDSKNLNEVTRLDTVKYDPRTQNNSEYFDSYALNFGNNNIYKIINTYIDTINLSSVTVSEDTLMYFKLSRPLDFNVDVLSPLWIVDELTDSFVSYAKFLQVPFVPSYNQIRGPNFDIDVQNNRSRETDFKTWNDLLAATTDVKNKVINSIFSGSIQGIDLNLDYTGFDNFVFYGSAKERIDAFYYKLQLVEYYDSQIALLSGASGSDAIGKAGNIEINRERKYSVLGSFDDFEKWLYNSATSSLFTHGATGSFIGADGYTITPYPKYLSSGSYVLHHTTSSLGLSWYNGLSATGSLYDEQNPNSLVNTIPLHIREDALNDQYVLFVNMIGHYYDIVWSYVDAMNKRYSTEQHPKLGIPKELLPRIANSMGWELINGKESKDLWSYKLGTSVSGSYQSTGSIFTKAYEDDTTEIWRRIVNNLPYVLKTKGTGRSVNALMNAYGIPQTLVPIREYGGPPVSSRDAALVDDRFNYALAFDTESNVRYDRVTLDRNLSADIIDTPPKTIMFRFKPTPTVSGSLSMLLHSAVPTDTSGFWGLILESTGSFSGSGQYARIRFSMCTGSVNEQVNAYTPYLPIYDNDWWNVMLSTDTVITSSTYPYSANITVRVQKASDYITGKIIHSGSATLNYTFNSDTDVNFWCIPSSTWPGTDACILIGGYKNITAGVSGSGKFEGNIQAYKEYMEEITQEIFDYHTLNPAAYRANNPTGSYTQLVRYYPFGVDGLRYNHSTNTLITSSHPRYGTEFSSLGTGTYGLAQSFPNPTSGYNYDDNIETFYTYTPDTFGSSPRSVKIRLESSDLYGRLDPTTRAEVSRFDNAPVDSNKLVIAFSPTDYINKDIYNHVGYVSLDDYFGLPAEQYKDSYETLHKFTNEYWKKYTQKNDINTYIRIFTLFDFAFFESLKQLVPARANLVSGLLIEPSVLERSKAVAYKEPSFTQDNYEANYKLDTELSLEAELTDYSASLNVRDDRFDGAKYSYTGVIFSGSSYITASTHPLEASPTGSYIDGYRTSTVYKAVEYHYRSFASWATTPYLIGYDIAVSQSRGLYYSRSLVETSYRDDNPTDITNLYYDGCRLTGPDFNVPTTATPDNGPVVEYFEVSSLALRSAEDSGNSTLSVL